MLAIPCFSTVQINPVSCLLACLIDWLQNQIGVANSRSDFCPLWMILKLFSTWTSLVLQLPWVEEKFLPLVVTEAEIFRGSKQAAVSQLWIWRFKVSRHKTSAAAAAAAKEEQQIQEQDTHKSSAAAVAAAEKKKKKKNKVFVIRDSILLQRHSVFGK